MKITKKGSPMSDDDPEITDISAELLRRQEEAEEAAPVRQVRSQPMPLCDGCSDECEPLEALGRHVCAVVRREEIAAHPPSVIDVTEARWSAERTWTKAVAKRWRPRGAPMVAGREASSDEIPQGAARLAKLAREHGWATSVTYAEGPLSDEDVSVASVVVRAERSSDGGWARAMYRRPGAKWSLDGCLLADRENGLRKVKSTELKAYLEAVS